MRNILIILAIFAGTAVASFGQIATSGERLRGPGMYAHGKAEMFRIHGRVTALDLPGNTVTISANGASKSLHFIFESAVIKGGAQAHLNMVTPGDEADGIATMFEGKLLPISFRFGPFVQVPDGTPIPGQPGRVRSPYNPKGGLVDVTGMPPGIEVKDPYSSKVFLVPKPSS